MTAATPGTTAGAALRPMGRGTTLKLTFRECKAAQHGGTSSRNARGENAPQREVLWHTETCGLGLRLLPAGREPRLLRFRFSGRLRLVTRGLSENFSEALVGRAVGHSSAATTRRYSHVSLEPTRRLLEHIGGEIAAALAGRPPGALPEFEQIPTRRAG